MSAARAPSTATNQEPREDVSPEAAHRAAAIARQTMSPFCPGRTLADCPSPNAAEWRSDIRDMVERGMSAAEIQDELEARIGSNLSGSPGREVSYAVPIGFGLLAFGVLGAVLFRLRRARSAPGAALPKEENVAAAARSNPVAAAAPDEVGVDDARLEHELRRTNVDPDDD